MAEYEHQNMTLKLIIFPSFGAATSGVCVMSAIITRKNAVYGQGPIACNLLYDVTSLPDVASYAK